MFVLVREHFSKMRFFFHLKSGKKSHILTMSFVVRTSHSPGVEHHNEQNNEIPSICSTYLVGHTYEKYNSDN